MATEPAVNAPPTAAQMAAIAKAFLRPSQSAVHPWVIAPKAAPAAKRAFAAPSILHPKS
jgi:hypothetical protein